jgi:hypothetical protein
MISGGVTFPLLFPFPSTQLAAPQPGFGGAALSCARGRGAAERAEAESSDDGGGRGEPGDVSEIAGGTWDTILGCAQIFVR